MWYVTMTDTFLSGWGKADGRINKLVIECKTLADARIVEENARLRSDMTRVNICSTKPRYSTKKYLTSIEDKDTYSNWFVPRYFAK